MTERRDVGRGRQCCAELEIGNGVAYCIREKGHKDSHRTAEITFDTRADPSGDVGEEDARMVAKMLHSFAVADGLPEHAVEHGETHFQRARRILARLRRTPETLVRAAREIVDDCRQDFGEAPKCRWCKEPSDREHFEHCPVAILTRALATQDPNAEESPWSSSGANR